MHNMIAVASRPELELQPQASWNKFTKCDSEKRHIMDILTLAEVPQYFLYSKLGGKQIN